MAKHPPVLVLNDDVWVVATVVYPSNTESILHFRDPCGCTGTDVVEVLFGLFDFMPHVTAQDADESLLSYTVSKDQKVTSGYLLLWNNDVCVFLTCNYTQIDSDSLNTVSDTATHPAGIFPSIFSSDISNIYRLVESQIVCCCSYFWFPNSSRCFKSPKVYFIKFTWTCVLKTAASNNVNCLIDVFPRLWKKRGKGLW